MNSYALDSNNELLLDGTRIARVVDGAQVVQAVRSRLLFYLGEWLLDTTAGVPYTQQIFVKPANLPRVESLLKTEILQTDGVAELISFSLVFDRTTRQVSVQFRARTTFDTIITEEVFINV